jgi:hypothetical protein
MHRSALVCVLAITTATAAAQPAAPEPPPATSPAPTASSPAPPGALSEGTALALATGATAASWLGLGSAIGVGSTDLAKLFAVSVVLAPSAGHWYAGSIVSRGMAIRAVGAALLVLAHSKCQVECSGDGDVLAASLALFIAGTLDDWISAPSLVRRHNAALRGAALVPLVRRNVAGIALAIRF